MFTGTPSCAREFFSLSCLWFAIKNFSFFSCEPFTYHHHSRVLYRLIFIIYIFCAITIVTHYFMIYVNYLCKLHMSRWFQCTIFFGTFSQYQKNRLISQSDQNWWWKIHTQTYTEITTGNTFFILCAQVTLKRNFSSQ